MGTVNDRPEWQSFGLTHQGNVRTHNEDAYLNFPEQHLWVVADGMGGHSAGDLASRAIIDHLEHYRHTPLLGNNVALIRHILDQVNQKLTALTRNQPNKIIGSTVAAFTALRHHGVCLWAGDSRIYRFREGRLKQITRDHNEADELMDQGISAAEAARSPYAQSITRAVGAHDELHVEAQIVELWDEDVYLLCSDGLNKEVSDQEIEATLATHPTEDSVSVLLNTCLERQGRDNVTIITLYRAAS